jgi:hypothetical protein
LSCTAQVANHRKAIGLLYAGVQTAANAGVPEDQAGLAAALITASFQLGSARGAPHALTGLIAQAEELLPQVVHDARDQELTWAQIGELLGTTAARRHRSKP